MLHLGISFYYGAFKTVALCPKCVKVIKSALTNLNPCNIKSINGSFQETVYH